jgi:hypothetical protein
MSPASPAIFQMPNIDSSDSHSTSCQGVMNPVNENGSSTGRRWCSAIQRPVSRCHQRSLLAMGRNASANANANRRAESDGRKERIKARILSLARASAPE